MSFLRKMFWVGILLCGTWGSGAPFEEGAKVCFLGDSITHGGTFHYTIYNYYVTRFPDRKVAFFNAGVSGDSAGGALGRLEEDVFSRNSDVVVFMFGMNDVGRSNYVANPSEQQLASQKRSLEGYRRNMKTLVNRVVEQLQPQLIFITPSPFDDTGENDRNNNQPGCNGALEKCAAMVWELAEATNGKVVDFHAPMTALNCQQQKENPRFTIVGSDRVHPQAPGHLMMAWLFLKAQEVPALVSDVVIDGAKREVTCCENAKISDFQVKNGEISFQLLEKSLPFPIDPAAASVLELIPVVEDLNQQKLRVSGLSEAVYELWVDGNVVGKYRRKELEQGINLAMNPAMPSYQQAQKVRELSLQRMATERLLRDYAASRWFLRRKVNPDDLAAVQAFYDSLSHKTGYYESRIPKYIAGWPQREAVMEKLAQEDAAVRAAAVPVKHAYVLKAVP
ncbi:MAG: SGNH/GDSL hydrolase family protein [Planctomycetia bacterium]|nr:SGNH/GDSL hydrolase family protein [Planctomycetia bacterium]